MPQSEIEHEELIIWMLTRQVGRKGDGELTSKPTTRGENGTPFINWRSARAMADRGWVRFLGRGDFQFIRALPAGIEAAREWQERKQEEAKASS